MPPSTPSPHPRNPWPKAECSPCPSPDDFGVGEWVGVGERWITYCGEWFLDSISEDNLGVCGMVVKEPHSVYLDLSRVNRLTARSIQPQVFFLISQGKNTGSAMTYNSCLVSKPLFRGYIALMLYYTPCVTFAIHRLSRNLKWPRPPATRYVRFKSRSCLEPQYCG